MIDLSKLPTTPAELHVGMLVGHLRLLRRLRENPKASQMVRKKWRCECTGCGTTISVPANYLVRRPSPKTHCGCQSKTIKTHYNREYRIWIMMRVRTTDPNHVAFKHYGGRGIKVCDAWFNKDTGFDAFLKHMGQAPTPTHTLDRINVDGNYEPGNVRWATPKEQAQNTRAAVAKRKAHGKDPKQAAGESNE